MLNNCLSLAFIVTVFCVQRVFTSNYVPVIYWGVDSQDPEFPALQHVGKTSFKELIEDITTNKTFMVVFEDEHLSLEDLSMSDYKPLEQMVSENFNGKIKYIPSVLSPSRVISTISKNTHTTYKASDIISGAVSLPKPAPGQITFISLEEAQSSEDRPHLLKRHVEFIVKLSETFRQQYDDILMIYTAAQPSWYGSEPNIKRKNRHLLQAEEDSGKIFNNTNIIFYTGKSPVIYSNKKEISLDNVEYTTSFDSETNFVLTGTSANGQFTLTFKSDATGYWLLTSASIQNSTFNVNNVYAPMGWSFQCTDLTIGGSNEGLKLSQIQVQAFFDNSSIPTVFGDVYYCVGFTSVPIWSGLFVTFILALIMTMGLCMIMDIKTMDRFDDPKGKTITVNATE